MWYKKETSDIGFYLDREGNRVFLHTASSIIPQPGQTPETGGWFFFESEKACLEAWGLTDTPVAE